MLEPLGRAHLDEPIFAHLRRDFVALDVSWTVGDALARLRTQQLGEKIIYFYAVDRDGRLEGIVPTRRLLMSEPDTPIAALMVTDVVTMPSWATVREASNLFLAHRFLAFPVVDANQVLHGIADVSLFTRELADMANRQSADNAFQLIGIHLVADAGPWAGFTDRFPWLLANVGGGLLAAFVTSRYQELLDAVVVLALFIPVVLALAESVSIQSVTLTLQSLRGPRQSLIPEARPLWKEFATAVLLGIGCGGLVGLVAGLWQGSLLLGLTILTAIALSMVTACILGVVLPAILYALRRDPGIAAGPIVLAIADLCTLIFYFNLAGWML
ncbi:MAG: magnesium transporter [Vicinamibacterales bacterium]